MSWEKNKNMLSHSQWLRKNDPNGPVEKHRFSTKGPIQFPCEGKKQAYTTNESKDPLSVQQVLRSCGNRLFDVVSVFPVPSFFCDPINLNNTPV